MIARTHLRLDPDLTLKEDCEAFEEQRGVGVSEATMSRSISRLPGGWPLRKKSKVASERDEVARTHEALLEAMEEALSKVTPADAAGWFDHCGYQLEIQYL